MIYILKFESQNHMKCIVKCGFTAKWNLNYLGLLSYIKHKKCLLKLQKNNNNTLLVTNNKSTRFYLK